MKALLVLAAFVVGLVLGIYAERVKPAARYQFLHTVGNPVMRGDMITGEVSIWQQDQWKIVTAPK